MPRLGAARRPLGLSGRRVSTAVTLARIEQASTVRTGRPDGPAAAGLASVLLVWQRSRSGACIALILMLVAVEQAPGPACPAARSVASVRSGAD